MSGECSDEVLQDLMVLSVVPAPNAGHLLVTVALRTQEVGLVEVLERLGRVEGLLRARVAGDTVRKRVPRLSFEVLRREAGEFIERQSMGAGEEVGDE